VAIWQQNKRFLAYLHCACAETPTYELPVKKYEPAIRSICYKTDAVPLLSDVYLIYSMFLCYYVAWHCDLDILPFDLESVSCPTHIPIFIILRLSVTELWVQNIWSHFRYLKQSLRMRRVTWPLTGGKNSPHFWIPWPQFAYSLCHFQEATTKIKPCYRRKIAFPIMKATKFTAHAQYHVTCA